ncbi:Ganglioside GM2 activator [Mizuhopecten yessoensis]|uniref:Ganglioside GM2 activator n=2 Tax=Mizuhopecten yessoensis TaxID=6573 RepID=A0A210Q585_MIZYE|nr:Ganglioside GM2 activator [Mizuhopecten yessoensis]
MKLTVRGNTTHPLDNAKLSITLHRDTFLLSIPIPCLLNLGSCTYDDICTLVDQAISENWGTITAGLATQVKTMLLSAGINPSVCPIPSSQLVLTEYAITLPSVPSVLSWLASGDYTVKAELKDKTTNLDLMCLDLKLTLTKASTCTGWLCGRRKRDILKNRS